MDTVPLNVEEEQRRSNLVHRLKQGTISLTEARDLLEREKHMIAQQGNCLALLAVTFLISYIDEYLEAKNKTSVLTFHLLFLLVRLLRLVLQQNIFHVV